MKPFKIGTKVEILYSPDDNPAEWVAGEVVNIVRPTQFDAANHQNYSGNIVKVGKSHITVTEATMIQHG